MQSEVKKSKERVNNIRSLRLHANWCDFIELCEKLGFGEIENLKIQNGVPVVAEVVKKKINFSKREGQSA